MGLSPNQFIWYSNRLVELQTSLLVTASLQCPHMVGIIDKQGFQKLAEQSKRALNDPGRL
ncbi:MAG: hypothetical protein U0Y68_13890 [Blastocatellia bacterium]